MIKDHAKLTRSLNGALDNAQPKITKPSDQLSSDKQAMIDQLNNTPRGSAPDNLFLTQQLQAHQQAWALQKGYAVDGDDAALRQVASTAVPTVESHLAIMKQLQAAQEFSEPHSNVNPLPDSQRKREGQGAGTWMDEAARISIFCVVDTGVAGASVPRS